jgi:hypothetical protein
MRRGEGAPVPDANGRNRRCRRGIVRCPPRLRKVKAQIDDEVAAAPVDRLLGVTGPRDRECVRVALPGSGKGRQRRFVAPQPASAWAAIAASSTAIRDHEVMSHSQPQRGIAGADVSTRSQLFTWAVLPRYVLCGLEPAGEYRVALTVAAGDYLQRAS